MLMEGMRPQQLLVMNEIRQKIRAEIKPRERISVNDYAEKFTQLPKEGALTGPWRSFPYMIDILNTPNNSMVREMTLVSSAQIAKTQMALRILGYIIEYMPVPIMVLLPTIDIAEKFSKTKFWPFVESTPSLRRKFGPGSSRESRDTILYKEFDGGFILFAGANSPNNLAMHSVGVVLSDDIDRIPPSAGEEGDPVDLAENRTESYRKVRYLHVRMTTPTIKGTSRGEKLLNKSSFNKRWVPCPACGEYQVLLFKNLEWDSETDLVGNKLKHYPETVRYVCEKCGHKIYDEDKYKMDEAGIWIPENPEVKTHAGYWINRLYSGFSTWEDMVRKFVEISPNDEEKRRVFTNTYLGEPFEVEEITEVDNTMLIGRVENYMSREKPEMPRRVLLLTAAVDVQGDRLELLVRGWGEGFESWDILYQKFYGNIHYRELWDELFEFVLDTDFVREDGATLRVKRLFVDSGYESQTVYEMCRDKFSSGVVCVKGQNGFDRNILPAGYTKIDKKRTRLLVIGVDKAKELLFGRLKISNPGPQYVHFSKEFCDFEYFGQLTGERLVMRTNKRNSKQLAFEKKSRMQRVEVLDLHVYNIAAIEHIHPNFTAIALKLEAQARERVKQEDLYEVDSEGVERDLPANADQSVQGNVPVRRKKRRGALSPRGGGSWLS